MFVQLVIATRFNLLQLGLSFSIHYECFMLAKLIYIYYILINLISFFQFVEDAFYWDKNWQGNLSKLIILILIKFFIDYI